MFGIINKYMNIYIYIYIYIYILYCIGHSKRLKQHCLEKVCDLNYTKMEERTIEPLSMKILSSLFLLSRRYRENRYEDKGR